MNNNTIHFTFLIFSHNTKRINAARPRIQALNPLVAVETYTEPDDWDVLMQRIDVLCLTDGTRQDIVSC